MPRPERSFRTPALIVRRRDFGEADRMLTVLTPAHGKFNVLAKGARKAVSTKTGHVELFTRADMLISRGRDIDLASQVEMVEPYLPLREDLTRCAYAGYVAELVDRFIAEDEEESRLFDLVDNTFKRISFDSDPRLAVRYYEIRLLDLVGYRPELNECVFSREPVLPEDQFFSFAEGGVVCPAQAHHSTNLTQISMTTLKILRHMQRSAYSHVQSLHITPPFHADLERILLGYITFLLERKLQSVDFIRRIRS
jgi:DNA repair protein RecO (recombination protein O)